MKIGDYKGRTVRLEKPIRERLGNKEYKVYVWDRKKKEVRIVRFGDANMKLKSHIPKRKKSYCARTKSLSKKGNKLSPNYWSRKRWGC